MFRPVLKSGLRQIPRIASRNYSAARTATPVARSSVAAIAGLALFSAGLLSTRNLVQNDADAEKISAEKRAAETSAASEKPAFDLHEAAESAVESIETVVEGVKNVVEDVESTVEGVKNAVVSETTEETETETETPEVAETPAAEGEGSQSAAFNPETGEINWDCPCLGGMAHGPCGEEFKAAFSCFVYSETEPKGIDCITKFEAMRSCFREHPEHYKEELYEDDEPVPTAGGSETSEGSVAKETATEDISKVA